MKVKVDVTTLIERVQARKDELRRQYREAQEKYPELEAAYRDELVHRLGKMMDRVSEGGRLPETSWTSRWNGPDIEAACIPTRLRKPVKPRPPHIGPLESRLRELRLTSSTELVVDPSAAEWKGIL